MNSRPPWAYRILAATAPALAAPVGLLLPAIGAARRNRAESLQRFVEWGERHHGEAPLVLWHAPSAGEWRQADPVLRRLRAGHPSWRWALTYTSPSAPAVVEALAPGVHGFLPWDRPGDVRRLLTALRPSLIVVTKLDLWPELAAEAAARGIPVALIAATVRPGSGRLRWPARAALEPAYRMLERAAAVSEEDAARLVLLGVVAERVEVLGDPRADQVLELTDQARPAATTDPWLLVAGSTWPADEAALLAALSEVRRHHPAARLLLAPHRPEADARERLTALATRHGLPAPVRWAPQDHGEPIRLLDQVGPLALAYGEGGLAYVGGGFGRAGLHAVLEPAAWGLPVLVGPGWRESRDAAELHRAGALQAAADAAMLAGCWVRWLSDPAAREAAGRCARQVVEQGRGAAGRTAGLLSALLERRGGRT